MAQMIAADMVDSKGTLACLNEENGTFTVEWRAPFLHGYGSDNDPAHLPDGALEDISVQHMRRVLDSRGCGHTSVIAAVPCGTNMERLTKAARGYDMDLTPIESGLADAFCEGARENGNDLILHRCMNELICTEIEWTGGEPSAVSHLDSDFGWGRGCRDGADSMYRELDRADLRSADRILITGSDPRPERFADILTDRYPDISGRLRIVTDATFIGAALISKDIQND